MMNMKAYIFLAAVLLSLMPYTADAQGTEINSRDLRGKDHFQARHHDANPCPWRPCRWRWSFP